MAKIPIDTMDGRSEGQFLGRACGAKRHRHVTGLVDQNGYGVRVGDIVILLATIIKALIADVAHW